MVKGNHQLQNKNTNLWCEKFENEVWQKPVILIKEMCKENQESKVRFSLEVHRNPNLLYYSDNFVQGMPGP